MYSVNIIHIIYIIVICVPYKLIYSHIDVWNHDFHVKLCKREKVVSPVIEITVRALTLKIEITIQY